MSARRLLAPAAVVAALAAAAALALVAADVLRWDAALERADRRFAVETGQAGMWTPATRLPEGVTDGLLEAGDDVRLREAVQLFRASRPREPVTQFSQLTARSAAERVLARVVREEERPQARALAANLRGALALEEARLSQGQSATLLRRAAAHFRQAVTLDPSYGDAKFNLELALRQLGRAGASSGGGGDRAETPASGAGQATAGSGY